MQQSVVTTQTSPPRPLARKEVRELATMFLAGATLCLVVLVAAVWLLRARTQRGRVARALGIDAQLARGKGPSTVDPWAEAGRRIAVDSEDDQDTVDIDPRDLGPDDIEPRGSTRDDKEPG